MAGVSTAPAPDRGGVVGGCTPSAAGVLGPGPAPPLSCLPLFLGMPSSIFPARGQTCFRDPQLSDSDACVSTGKGKQTSSQWFSEHNSVFSNVGEALVVEIDQALVLDVLLLLCVGIVLLHEVK